MCRTAAMAPIMAMMVILRVEAIFRRLGSRYRSAKWDRRDRARTMPRHTSRKVRFSFAVSSNFDIGLTSLENARRIFSGHKKRTYGVIFFHPDYTVGIGIAPIRPEGSRTLPPVGKCSLP